MPFFFSIFWAGKDERITCEGKVYQSDMTSEVSRIFSRPGSVKSSIPKFKITTVNSILTTGKVIHKKKTYILHCVRYHKK